MQPSGLRSGICLLQVCKCLSYLAWTDMAVTSLQSPAWCKAVLRRAVSHVPCTLPARRDCLLQGGALQHTPHPPGLQHSI